MAEHQMVTERGIYVVTTARSAMNDALEGIGLGRGKHMPSEWNVNPSAEITFIGADGEMRVAPVRPTIFENDDEIVFTTVVYMPKSTMRLT